MMDTPTSHRLLLSGAGGFVGSHILRHVLTTTDWDVVCPVTFTHRGRGDRIRLAVEDRPEWLARIDVVRTDLAAPISAQTTARWGVIDYVINAASESHVDRSIAEPASFVLNNVALMCHLLDWARRPEVAEHLRAFVHISTDEVYGPAPHGYAHREWRDLHLPSSPYASSKACQEDVAFSYWRTYGVPVVIAGSMNMIGETQDAEKFIPMVIRKVLRGEWVTIHASPEGVPGSRFYLHARNLADALLWLLRTQHPTMFDQAGGLQRPSRWHVVGEREVDNLTLASMIAAEVGKPLQHRLVDFHSSRPGHDLRYALDGTLIREAGWSPPVPLDESLRRTVAWTLRNPEWLDP